MLRSTPPAWSNAARLDALLTWLISTAASSVATLRYLAGSGMWMLPVAVLLVFSCPEAAFSFSVVCRACTARYRLRPAA